MENKQGVKEYVLNHSMMVLAAICAVGNLWLFAKLQPIVDNVESNAWRIAVIESNLEKIESSYIPKDQLKVQFDAINSQLSDLKLILSKH